MNINRFKLEKRVSHQKQSARLILWDPQCHQLIKQTASDLKKKLMDVKMIC